MRVRGRDGRCASLGGRGDAIVCDPTWSVYIGLGHFARSAASGPTVAKGMVSSLAVYITTSRKKNPTITQVDGYDVQLGKTHRFESLRAALT